MRYQVPRYPLRCPPTLLVRSSPPSLVCEIDQAAPGPPAKAASCPPALLRAERRPVAREDPRDRSAGLPGVGRSLAILARNSSTSYLGAYALIGKFVQGQNV